MQKYSKYLIGFALFAGYFLLMRNLENKVSLVRKLGNLGGSNAS